MKILNKPLGFKLKYAEIEDLSIIGLVANDLFSLLELVGNLSEGVMDKGENLQVKDLLTSLSVAKNKDKLFSLIAKGVNNINGEELAQLRLSDLCVVLEKFIEVNDLEEIVTNFLSLTKRAKNLLTTKEQKKD